MVDSSSASTADTVFTHEDRSHKRGCGGMAKRRWSVPEIAIVIGSFVVFWPVGIAVLAVKLTKGELWAGSSAYAPPWQNPEAWRERAQKAWSSGRSERAYTSGNSAFDSYRQTQLDRLEQERKKLDEERAAFSEHLAKLRRARDQDEFDRFMNERRGTAN
jgi:hypothetical protein